MELYKVVVALLLATYIITILLVSGKEKVEISGSKFFMMERLFFVGSFFYGRFPAFRLKSISRNREQILEELYDGKELRLIKQNLCYSKITYAMLLIPCIACIGVILENKKIVLLFIMMLIFLVIYPDVVISQKSQKRHEEIMNSYPGVLTKISVLVNAGIPLIEAFDRVSNSGNTVLYAEMHNCVDAINNGVPYDVAFERFSKKCGCREIRRFVTLCNQNIFNGDSDLIYLLGEISNTAWEERKTRAKLSSERASELLLLPIILMFSGVMIMVIVPAFENLF